MIFSTIYYECLGMWSLHRIDYTLVGHFQSGTSETIRRAAARGASASRLQGGPIDGPSFARLHYMVPRGVNWPPITPRGVCLSPSTSDKNNRLGVLDLANVYTL